MQLFTLSFTYLKVLPLLVVLVSLQLLKCNNAFLLHNFLIIFTISFLLLLLAIGFKKYLGIEFLVIDRRKSFIFVEVLAILIIFYLGFYFITSRRSLGLVFCGLDSGMFLFLILLMEGFSFYFITYNRKW